MTKADETTETDFWAKDEEYERDITNWLVVAYDENADLADIYRKMEHGLRISVMRILVLRWR